MTSTILIILALLLAAMVLFLLEVLTPSFGLIAVLGIAALGGAVWQAFTVSTLFGTLLILGILLATPAYLMMAVRLLPRSPIGKRMFLRKARSGEGEAAPEADELDKMVGKTGQAETTLRPSGAVRIDHKRVIALAESGTIEKGSSVKVIRVSGTNLYVRKLAPRGEEA
jgi:membrane-bound serine protease (ClpP class)